MFTATLKLNLVAWGFGLALVTFIVSTATVAFLIVTLPANYFTQERDSRKFQHPILRVTFLILKNILGLVIILAGILMLFSPGQGLLTIAIGVMLLDFPGKRQLELKLIRQPSVLKPINQLRIRFGKPPLTFDDP